MAKSKVSLGTFEFSKVTKNTRRYEREDDDGRRDTIYVKKVVAAKLGDPDAIEVTISVADSGDEE